ncbi:MAG: tetratricopeptide repeat protein [Chitinophagales bacterium]
MINQSKYTIWIFFLILIPLIAFGGRKDKKKKKNKKEQQLSKSDKVAVQSMYLDATKAKILEDFQEAVNKFEKVVRMDPGNSAAFYELALLFYKSKQYEEALKYINEAVKTDESKNKWYLILQGEINAQMGNNKAAAETYSKLLEHYPKEIDYYFELAFQQIKSEDYKAALKTYEALEDIIGFNENIALQKQRLYIKMDDLESAIVEINRLIDMDPENPEYYHALADLYRTNKMPEKEVEVYKKIMELDSDNPFALFNLAEIKRKEGDREAYMEYLKKAFRNEEVGEDTKIRVLFPYLTNPETDTLERKEAMELVEIAAEVHPQSAKVFALYGDFYYQDNKLDKAREKYTRALENDNSVFEVWQQLFFILSDQQDYNELLERTDNALELFPNQAIIYFFNGMALNQQKKHQEAVDILEAGKDLVVNNKALKSQMLATLGDAYNSLEKYPKSDEAFEAALELDPENSYVMNNYSYYLSLRGENLERAKELSKKSNDLEPNTVSFQDTYGWILYKMKEFNEAEKWIKKAIDNGGEDNAVILEHYGDILYKLGKEEEALQYWKKAAMNGSESDLINKKIADKKLYE